MEACPANYVPLTPISFIERAASVYSDRTSIIYGRTRFTWAQTFCRCRQLASALAFSLHIQPGQVVSAVVPNVPAMYEMHFGVPMVGAVLNTINIRLDAKTLSVLLKHSDSKAVFVDYQFEALVRDALDILSNEKGGSKLPILVIIRDPESNPNLIFESKGELDYETLLRGGDPEFEIRWPKTEWETITLNYTSGTTSNPKGVAYHHRGAYLTPLIQIVLWGMKEGPTYLWTVPMFHCNGWCFTWAIAAVGGTNVCLRNINAKSIYDAIVEHKVTHLCGAPIVLNVLASAPTHEIKPISSIVEVITGGAPPPPAVLASIEKRGFHVLHSYGLTETFGPALYCSWKPEWDELPSKDQANLKSRQGIPHLGLAHASVKNPSTMENIPCDGKTIGEVMVRGNTIMKGYLKDEKATQKAFEGGWFHTGDLAVIHSDGYIQLKDRSKDIIISGGENISSIEVESTLYHHPKVLEAAVVARPDEFWGETPCAFVQLKENSDNVSPEEIISFCRSHLPHYMVPKTVVFGEMPKTATGKIQKFLLRERAKAMGSLSRSSLSRL